MTNMRARAASARACGARETNPPAFTTIFQPYVVLVSRFKIVVRLRARAAYLFSYGISRAGFSLGNRYLK